MEKLKFNPGWADAMAKVLKQKKPLGKKSIVLSKAKKIEAVKEEKHKPDLGFQIVGLNDDEVHGDGDDDFSEKKQKFTTREYQAKGRIKPDILEKYREKVLVKIATKGVVQLFNAVRQQQKTVEKTLKKAGKSEHKREKLLETIDKKKFLDALTGSIKSSPINKEVKSENEDMDMDEEETNTWSVLSDNFMTGTKLKDWDKLEDGNR